MWPFLSGKSKAGAQLDGLAFEKKNSRKSESRAGVPLPGQPFLLQLRSQPGDGGGRAGTGAGIAALGAVAWPLGLDGLGGVKANAPGCRSACSGCGELGS